MFPVFLTITDNLTDQLKKAMVQSPEGFRIDEFMERYSVKVIAQAFLGYPCNAFADEDDVVLRYVHAFHDSTSAENFITGLARLFPSLTTLLKPLDWKHKTWTRRMNREAQTFVNHTQTNSCQACPVMRSLIAHSILAFKSKEDETESKLPSFNSLSEQDIADQVMGLLAAGLGPFAVTLTFIIYCMAVNEGEQEKVVEEIKATTSCKNIIDLEEIKRMKILERFIFEAMRVFPVAPGVTRECVEDCVIFGHEFRRGMVIRIMSGAIYRKEEHFEQFHKFMPDRFKNGGHLKNAWMPFGLGPRKCVADRLALVILKLCIARILQQFHIAATEGTQ
ncbi:cytochrome p450, partial [Plakobranchus ocellatus]